MIPNWLKVAATVAVLSLLAANLGFMVARDLGMPSHARVEAAKSGERSAEKQRGGRQEQGRQTSEAPPAAPEFHGSKHANPADCYAGEKEGECAARMVQERVAGFTIYLVFGTLGQLAVALFVGAATVYLVNRQKEIAGEQAAISEAQANTQKAVADLERPTLFVTRLSPVGFRPLKNDPSDGTERCEPVVQMHFANFGRTPAVLLAIEGDILLARKPPGIPLGLRMKTQLRRFQIMATGEEKSAAVLIVGHPVPAAYEGQFRGRQIGALVRGRFVYRDPFGVRLETGFELVPGEGGEPLPGNYVGNNYYRPWDADAPDAPHRNYGA